jgi:hypothetical protein
MIKRPENILLAKDTAIGIHRINQYFIINLFLLIDRTKAD